MKFLVVTKAKMFPPPEMAMALLNAVDAWVKKYKSSGKLEQVWGFAGLQGGGGIGNVNSLEEFDEILLASISFRVGSWILRLLPNGI